MAKTKWTLDTTHRELGCRIKHLMITSVSGSLRSFQVDAEADEADFTTAKISLRADMSSIFTNNEQRDAHVRTADFFEVEKYPELKFQSTRIEKTGDDNFILYGDLSLKGVSRPVKLNVEYSIVPKDSWDLERAGLVVTGKINRSDWGYNL
jgi:polyisoprenoid-binding protein YceI